MSAFVDTFSDGFIPILAMSLPPPQFTNKIVYDKRTEHKSYQFPVPEVHNRQS